MTDEETGNQIFRENVITQEEQMVLDALAEAWNQYLKLPVLHQWSQTEFMYVIHHAQDIVLARSGQRQLSLEDQDKVADGRH